MSHRRIHASILALAATAAPIAAQVLEVHDASLTAYLPASSTGVQDVQPLPAHRGVFIDGTLAAPPTFPWALGADTFEQTGWNKEAWLGDLRLHAGTYQMTDVDINLPAPGFSWVVGRSYNPRQHDGSGYYASDGPQGRNWFQMSQPELVFFDNNSQVADEEEDMIVLVYGADRYVEFRRVQNNSDSFRAVNGAAGVMRWFENASSPDLIEFTDPFGVKTTFFGIADADIPDAKEGQIWTIEDPAGNIAYVGHETDASQALTDGYDSSGRITEAYDTAVDIGRRRFSYTYSSGRLTEVKAETKTTGSWSAPSGVLAVATVEYFYHDGLDDHGSAGDLKRVQLTMPVADGLIDQELNKYYRYYKGTYNGGSNPGHDGQLKLVMGFEGTRRFDWDQVASGAAGFDYEYENAALDDTFKKYVDAYFEYKDNADERRLSTIWFNGECGCPSSTNGVYAFKYEPSSYYGTNKTSGYDSFWAERTVTTMPPDVAGNVAYQTTYFDEAGQPLTRVITDGNPDGEPADTWVTHATRDSGGRLATIHRPANIATYTHGSTAISPVSTSGSEGLVLVYSRVATGDAAGFLAHAKYREGDPASSPTNYLEQSIEYTVRSETIGDATLLRPLATAVWDYTEQTTSEAQTGGGSNPSGAFVTQFAHTFFSNTAGQPDYMALKSEVVTHPAVSASKNGSGTSNTRAAYLRKDGTTAFDKDEAGSFTYYSLDSVGLNDRIIDDAKTNSADFDAGDDPSTVWGISETGVGLHEIIDYTYDDQGRLATTARDPGGAHERRRRSYVTRLADHRQVRLEVPRYTTSGSTTYYGPAAYTVLNQAGEVVAEAVIGIDSAGTTTAIDDWIDDTAGDDPLQSLGSTFTGTIERLSTSIYDEAGRKLLAERTYHSIPATLEGTHGTNYEQVEYGYDNRGRRDRVVDVKGTITRTAYDIRGQWITGIWMGTNDDGWAGGDSLQDTSQFRAVTPGINGGSPKSSTVPPLYYSSANGGPVSGVSGPGGDGSDGDTATMQCWMLVWDSSNSTVFTRDVRGNVIVRENPLAPHLLVKYDNMNRIVAIGFYSSAPGATEDPTSYANDRLGLVEYAYDEMGRVWKVTRHEIDAADGSDDDSLDSLFWRDAVGRVVKADGPDLIKRIYDGLGRVTHEFVLANDNDTSYAHAIDPDLTGDVVLEEHQWLYEASTGNLKAQATVNRHHDVLTTTGPLDTDSGPWTYTASNLKGRIDITAYWYDALDRVADTVEFGTYGLGESGGPTSVDLDGLGVPARSDTALRTSYSYDKAGAEQDVTDPRNHVSRSEYDDAGRVTATIRNYTGATPPLATATRDSDLYTRFTYGDSTQDPWVDELWVDIDGDGTQDHGEDQVTRYTYGVSGSSSTPDSDVSLKHLLQKVEYPDSAGVKDTIRYGYERNGRVARIYDQDEASASEEGTLIQIAYDKLGRETGRSVTFATDSDLDQFVRHILTSYDDLGRVSTVKQEQDDLSTIDEVKITYDGWGNVKAMQQDYDSAVGGAGPLPTYSVDYSYAKATGGRNTVRRTGVTLPGSNAISYIYSSTGGLYDNDASRVTEVRRGNAAVALYDYLGTDIVAGVEYPEPEVFRRHYGSTSGHYPGLDRFNRVTSDRWTKDLSPDVDFYSVDVAYDPNGNPTLADDQVHLDRFDARWTIDEVDRLTRTEQGDWSGSGFNSLSQDELWDYTPVGGWDLHKLDIDGNGSFTNYAGGDLQDRGTLNTANELTERDIDDDSTADFTLAYDDLGNLTDDGEHYKYVYDPFGRLRKILKRSNNALVAEYRYNGLGYLIGIHEDTDGDGDVDGDDAWRRLVYDHRWRVVAEHQDAETTPRLFYVHHAAGLDGRGTGSYIDQIICRERRVEMAEDGTITEGGNAFNERLYYCQNRRADVVAIVDSSGRQVEQARYSAYGVPFGLPAGDADSNGAVDFFDYLEIQDWISNSIYDVRGDLDLDGDVDAADASLANGMMGTTLGRGALSRESMGNRFGYAGYFYHGTVLKYHVRNRVYDPYSGRWTRRDPIEYGAGVMNLYEYVGSSPLSWFDPLGLGPVPDGPEAPYERWWPRYPLDKPSTPLDDGPSLIIYIDAPGGASVGHAFIECVCFALGETTGPVGFYPVPGWDKIRAPGQIRDDSSHPYDTWIQIPTTWEDYERARKSIESRQQKPGRYDLFAQNCASFVCGICAAIGVPADASGTVSDNPGDLEEWFRKKFPGPGTLLPGPRPPMPGEPGG